MGWGQEHSQWQARDAPRMRGWGAANLVAGLAGIGHQLRERRVYGTAAQGDGHLGAKRLHHLFVLAVERTVARLVDDLKNGQRLGTLGQLNGHAQHRSGDETGHRVDAGVEPRVLVRVCNGTNAGERAGQGVPQEAEMSATTRSRRAAGLPTPSNKPAHL